MQDDLHAADNSVANSLLGLLTAGVGAAGQILAPPVNQTTAKQQTLTTPGTTTGAASTFNWKPWAIGGGIFVAIGLGAFFLFRKRG